MGNNPITENSTIGSCPELSATANYLASTPQYQNEPGSLSIHWECQNNSTICWNLGWCNWDNSGWTCDSFTKRNHTFDNTNKDCILQWTASIPFPVANSSIPALTNNSAIATPLPNNPYLVEEITFPVGVVVVGSLSGLTYYLLRKKKAKTQQQIQNSEEIELTTLKKRVPLSNDNNSQYVKQSVKIGSHYREAEEGKYRNVVKSLVFKWIYLEPGLLEMWSELGVKLVRDQCFTNGNKRTGFYSLVSFIKYCGFELDLDKEEWEKLLLEVADSKKDKEKVIKLVKERILLDIRIKIWTKN